MQIIKNQTFDEERALYGSKNINVIECRFDGPADGESAFKECNDVSVKDCFFNLRYPFWHDKGLKIAGSEMTELCRAALWYSEDVEITDTKMYGIKALRECAKVKITGCDIISPEFGWSVRGLVMADSSAESEYFMMRSDHLEFDHVKFKGKYSFQYITDSVFTNCEFDTKDAFWHAKNVVVKDSIVKGEYLAWYCENVTFENCTLIGTQPLCYCKGLKLINCRMVECDLAFEKSEVEAEIISDVVSIKNPLSGKITVSSVGELIMDDPNAKGKVFSGGKEIHHMKYRVLGKTGLRVSEIGFGGEWLERHPEEESIALMKYANEKGINKERAELYKLCEEYNVGITVMKGFAGGRLFDEKRSPFGVALTSTQCIHYALTRPGVASILCGYDTKEQVDEAVSYEAATDEEKDYASVLSHAPLHSYRGECTYCGHCKPCVANLDIAMINKYYDLATMQPEVPESVKSHYMLLEHKASECIGCKQCEEICPFGVSIADRMKKTVTLFGE